MPPTQSSGRGRPAAGATKSAGVSKAAANSSIRATGKSTSASANGPRGGANKKQKAVTLSDDENDSARRQASQEEDEEPEEDEEDDERESIPPELLSRIINEHFEHEDTKITKDANNALSAYMDVFVREAIARAAAERKGGFLEVEDLEKIAPQLVLDL
ncbi:CENP-S associating centromere protein X-domain-containing protein [Triangularia verruculosa]|uniref:CENP-S associating centromere protein X-domain-containing protein n=1 Tax=Triangularia verruculosa TaxID=2587418 RepID=A0AAN6XB85_9PEZI|nr:CENP-S associating centromere protein X-domain-containing protein [Triangularia verruculosa]